MTIDNCDVILLDVEGTVAPISFVYDVLFPYAADHLEEYVTNHWDQLEDVIVLFEQQAAQDLQDGLLEVVSIPSAESGSQEERMASVIQSARWQMDTDRKTTGLKSLQGQIWKGGFESGKLKSVVFQDVPEALTRWTEAGKKCAIYSSGSVQSQKLFFRYCEAGDLSVHLAGYFDTQVGAKRESTSYDRIAGALGVTAERVFFATDVVAEADAALAAGMQTGLLARPGNPEQPKHNHPVFTDFTLGNRVAETRDFT